LAKGTGSDIPVVIELLLLILTSVGHVVVQLLTRGVSGSDPNPPTHSPEAIYNGAAALAWAIYLVVRVVRDRSYLREAGFTRQGFGVAFRDSLIFAAVATIPLFLIGAALHRFPIPTTFWLLVGVYPLWGIAQQFALQALVTRNLRRTVPGLAARIAVASVLFSLAHAPDLPLMGLTLGAGVGFTWLYERHRNLWAIGIVHGWLGASAFYFVLGEDPGAKLLNLL
jgi:uncharacterized protein